MADPMPPQDFKNMFAAALTDPKFRADLQASGFKALEARGIAHGVPPDVQQQLETALARAGAGAAVGYKCGLCGVCGTCGLCAGVNFGAASAALWATFVLGVEEGGLREVAKIG